MKRLSNVKYPLEEDVSSISGIIKAFYDVVSGEAGEIRQWERDISLHNPNAVYSFWDNLNGTSRQLTMTLSDFHKETDKMVLNTAFYESEVNREVRIFGNIAHVWSTYETRLIKDGLVARRGINSLQLFYENGRWWILSLMFDREREDNKIPQTFERQ